jgi:hypothetical protein
MFLTGYCDFAQYDGGGGVIRLKKESSDFLKYKGFLLQHQRHWIPTFVGMTRWGLYVSDWILRLRAV